MKTNYTRLEPETLAYTARVIADGGEIISQFDIDQAYKFLKRDGLNLANFCWHSAQFGLIKDGSNAVSKLYDLSSNNWDATQSTGALQPLWVADQQNGKAVLRFDGTNVIGRDWGVDKAQPNYRFVTCKSTGDTSSIRITMDSYGNTSRHAIFYSPETGYIATFAQDALYSSTVTTGDYELISTLFNGGSSQIWLNSSSIATGDAGSYSCDGQNYGADRGTTILFIGDICDGLTLFGDQSAHLAKTNDFLNMKWELY